MQIGNPFYKWLYVCVLTPGVFGGNNREHNGGQTQNGLPESRHRVNDGRAGDMLENSFWCALEIRRHAWMERITIASWNYVFQVKGGLGGEAYMNSTDNFYGPTWADMHAWSKFEEPLKDHWPP